MQRNPTHNGHTRQKQTSSGASHALPLRKKSLKRPAIVLALVLALATTANAQQPADYRSRNFVLHTDIPTEEAELLLEKLESMLSIISRYWAAPSRTTIECYVVKDVRNWSPAVLPAEARSVVQRGGITVAKGVRRGKSMVVTAKVYASSKFGTAQHEAVHAYCYQTFGRTGPTWYAEGMAELGNYWKDENPTVTAPQYVIQYLKQSKRKSLPEITDTKQQTGDGWQNYAWRWALCHFLVNNPNYQDRFRILGANFLSGRTNSFQRSFGSQTEELEFEFQQFVDHLSVGLNLERCAWDWKAKYKLQIGSRPITCRVYANRGWQPSGLLVEKGQRYTVSCSGQWKTSSDQEVSADGNTDGTGRLVAAIFDNNKLGPNIKLGASTSFRASRDGKLVLRCQDEWNDLQDNSSFIEIQLLVKATTSP